MTYFALPRRHVNKSACVITLMLLLAMLLSACGGDPQAQQQAISAKKHLDGLLAHARSIGVPDSRLVPIVKQERQISSTSAPFSVFDQPITDYYNNTAQHYQTLAVEVTDLEKQVTQEFDYQAYMDIQDFEKALAGRQAQNFVETKIFADQLAQDQGRLAKARYPNEYLQISYSARRSTQALGLMWSAYTKLQTLRQMTEQLKESHVDTPGLTQQANDDLGFFRTASQPEDFTYLIDQINVQLQQATTLSTLAIPYIGAYEGQIKLEGFRATINEGKKYGLDATPFQQRLDSDTAALAVAKANEYSKILAQIDNDIAAIQLPLIRAKTNFFLKQFQHEVWAWGNSHQYLNQYDNHSYRLDYEYDKQGIGSDVVAIVQSAQTIDDYQAAITLINNYMLHLKAMEADYHDRSPWDWAHGADFTLMKHYNFYSAGTGSVIVVSLFEQVLRFYQNGKLVRAFQITTGQYARPTPPGLWNIFLRQHPTEFKSSEPQGSAFWYPPTKIEYAMEYHDGGYFLHDSWWRADYGMGTNFPHYDSGGDETFAGNGSHGCINMVPDDVAWLYHHTGYGTAVIVY